MEKVCEFRAKACEKMDVRYRRALPSPLPLADANGHLARLLTLFLLYADGQRIAMRVDPIGVITPTAAAAESSLYFFLGDHLGSTTVVADEWGSEVGHVVYSPYGTILASTLPLTITDRLFTGQRWDATIGLYDYNARFYDPQTGTFIQPDSIVPDPGNPIAWNRFAYVYNNPVNNVDPSGHFVVLAAIDTLWDAIDLYSDLRDCLGDSDSMACYMAAAGVAFIAMGALEGPSNNVARRAAKAADVGDAAGDVGKIQRHAVGRQASDTAEGVSKQLVELAGMRGRKMA